MHLGHVQESQAEFCMWSTLNQSKTTTVIDGTVPYEPNSFNKACAEKLQKYQDLKEWMK